MLVSQNVPHLLDGISQRPEHMRKTSEGTAQVNGYDNLGRGKQKRPPVELIKKLTATTTGLDNAFMHVIGRDLLERYHVVIANGDLRVYDAVTGEEKSVLFPNGKAYLGLTTILTSRGDTFTDADATQITAHEIAAFGNRWTQWLNAGVKTGTIRTNKASISFPLNGASIESYLWPSPAPSADYTVRANVSFTASGASSVLAGVVGRAASGTGGYVVFLDRGGQLVRLAKLNANGTEGAQLAVATAQGYVDAQSYNVKLVFAGTTITVFVDGVQKFSVVDGTFAAAGLTGFFASSGVSAGGVANVDDWSLDYSLTSTDAINSPLRAFRAVTIGDYTFISNRTVTVAKTANTVAVRNPEALVFVRQADYSTAYKVTVDATTFSYTTGDGNNPSSRAGITTDNIAEQLRLAFVASALNATHTCTRTGSTLYIKRINNGAFTITATDGLADNAILAIKGSIQRFDDLPLRAVTGVILEVTGDPGSQFDNYHVVYDDSGSATGAGVWRETVKPTELYQLDPATMPYVLVNNAGSFTFQQAAWRGREVGSIVTNPFPSFVGKQIREVFFTQGRFGVTASENVVLSGVSDVFNFFRKSAKALYDNDPIDIASASTKIMNWHSVLEWDAKPFLWSEQGQALLEGEPILSPKTVRLRVLTSYENQPYVRPATVGKNIFFAQVINGQTRISVYQQQPNSDIPVAIDITDSVKSFILGNPISIVGTDEPGFVVVRTDNALNTLYIFGFSDENASWSKWTIESLSSIIGMDFLFGAVGILVKRSDGLYLEKINLGKTNFQASLGETVPILLDHATTATGAGAGASYTLPMSVAVNGSEGEVVVLRTDTKVEVVSTRPTPTTVQVAANLTGVPIVYGIRYSLSYTLSPMAIVNATKDGPKKETAGKLIVGHVVLRLQDTGYVLVTVTSPEGVVYTYAYSQAAPLASDTLQFPVQADAKLANVVISNDKALQCTLTGYDWEGNQVIRSARR